MDAEKPIICIDYMGCFKPLKKRSSKPTAIVIHHTCTRTPAATRHGLKKKGYSTHFEVDTNGMIYQYAYVMERCVHCGSANAYTIGIDVTHQKDAPFPIKQVTAVRSLVSWLCLLYGIPQDVHKSLSGIYPHKALASTECPQDFPMDELDAVKTPF